MLVAALMLLAGTLSSMSGSGPTGFNSTIVTQLFLIFLLILAGYAVFRRVRVMSSDRD